MRQSYAIIYFFQQLKIPAYLSTYLRIRAVGFLLSPDLVSCHELDFDCCYRRNSREGAATIPSVVKTCTDYSVTVSSSA